MKHFLRQYWTLGLSVLFGIGVFLFWFLAYPHALSYQEQYQLFQWTGDYFWQLVGVPGGLADWLGEFIVQFYYLAWAGALWLSVLFVALQRLSAVRRFYLLSFLPPLLLLWLMGDPSVLLSLPVAVVLALAAFRLFRRRVHPGFDVLIVPALYWLAGPVAWLYVVLRLVDAVFKGGGALKPARYRILATVLTPCVMLGTQLLAYAFLLPQWPLQTVMTGLTYYRIPLHYPALSGYDREMYELIREDYLVRNEQWDEIVDRARQYQVRTAFSSVCVNLALAKKRQLADRMFDFYQSGEDALIMPRIRDLTSMLPTAEVFWHLGMVNSAQRYMFDTQESILNGRKSGRCTKRIAECMIVNGHYDVARKQLALLKKSLFYRDWAKDVEANLTDAWVSQHPVYGKLRRLRYKDDFLYSYAEIDKMLGLLFLANQENRMALDYFMGQMLLKGELRGFQQYMGWVQQYGGYRVMPLGYQDAMICIQKQGAVPGSPYANYAKRMMAERRDR